LYIQYIGVFIGDPAPSVSTLPANYFIKHMDS